MGIINIPIEKNQKKKKRTNNKKTTLQQRWTRKWLSQEYHYYHHYLIGKNLTLYVLNEDEGISISEGGKKNQNTEVSIMRKIVRSH